MTTPFDPQLTFQVMAALSPLFTLLIRSPIAVERFGEVGFSRDDWWERYFAFRSAQMGAASLDLVGERFEEGRVMPQIEAVLEAALHGRPLPESGALSRAPLVEMRPPGKRDA